MVPHLIVHTRCCYIRIQLEDNRCKDNTYKMDTTDVDSVWSLRPSAAASTRRPPRVAPTVRSTARQAPRRTRPTTLSARKTAPTKAEVTTTSKTTTTNATTKAPTGRRSGPYTSRAVATSAATAPAVARLLRGATTTATSSSASSMSTPSPPRPSTTTTTTTMRTKTIARDPEVRHAKVTMPMTPRKPPSTRKRTVNSGVYGKTARKPVSAPWMPRSSPPMRNIRVSPIPMLQNDTSSSNSMMSDTEDHVVAVQQVDELPIRAPTPTTPANVASTMHDNHDVTRGDINYDSSGRSGSSDAEAIDELLARLDAASRRQKQKQKQQKRKTRGSSSSPTMSSKMSVSTPSPPSQIVEATHVVPRSAPARVRDADLTNVLSPSLGPAARKRAATLMTMASTATRPTMPRSMAPSPEAIPTDNDVNDHDAVMPDTPDVAAADAAATTAAEIIGTDAMRREHAASTALAATRLARGHDAAARMLLARVVRSAEQSTTRVRAALVEQPSAAETRVRRAVAASHGAGARLLAAVRDAARDLRAVSAQHRNETARLRRDRRKLLNDVAAAEEAFGTALRALTERHSREAHALVMRDIPATEVAAFWRFCDDTQRRDKARRQSAAAAAVAAAAAAAADGPSTQDVSQDI